MTLKQNKLEGGFQAMGNSDKKGRAESHNDEKAKKRLSKKELRASRTKIKNKKTSQGEINDRKNILDSIQDGIKGEKVRWEVMMKKKIDNFSLKNISSLEKSKEFHQDKISNLRSNFDANIQTTFVKLIDKMLSLGQEEEVSTLKEEYIEYFEEIVTAIDRETEKKKLDNSLSDAEDENKTKESWMKNMLKSENGENNIDDFSEGGTVEEKEIEIEKVVAKTMSEREKTSFFEGLSSIGFGLSFVRSKTMGSITKGLAHLSKKSDYAHKFFKEYTSFYDEDAESSKKAMTTMGKNKKENAKGLVRGSGTAIKTYRVLSDLAETGTTRALNPFRHITAGAMFVGRSAEILKRSVVKREDKIEKNRIADTGEAMAEAERIFKIDLKKGESGNLSKEDLDKAYRENIPQNIIDRIERGGGLKGAGLMQYLFKEDAEGKANRVLKKLDKLDKKDISDEKKERKRSAIFARYTNLLEDLDKMISHEGAIDNLSYTARTMEDAGKKTANVFMVETIARLVDTGFNMHLYEKAWDKGGKAYEDLSRLIKDKFSNTIAEPIKVDMGKDYSSLVMSHDSVDSSKIDEKKVRDVLDKIKESHKVVEPVFTEEEIARAPQMTERVEEDEATQSIANVIKNNLVSPEDDSSNKIGDKAVAPMDEDLKLNSAGIPVVIDQTEASEYSVPESTEDREYYLKEARKGMALMEQMEQATIQAEKGANSIEGVFIKQLVANPEKFGFDGDLDNKDIVKSWANGEAHRIAMDNGYFDKETGQGVWMKASSVGHNAYILNGESSEIGVDEYVDGELRESHTSKSNFENGDTDFNEKVHDPKIIDNKPSQEADTILGDTNQEVKIIGQKEILDQYQKNFGIGSSELKQVNIDPSDGFSESESEKIKYLINHHADLQKSIGVVKIAEDLNVSRDIVNEYYYQLDSLSGNTLRQDGLLDVLRNKNYMQGFSKIFNLSIPENDFVIKDGLTKIKNVYPNFDIVIKNNAGEVKFGIDGPMAWNWGAGGRSWFLKVDAELTNENIDKAIAEMKKMAKGYSEKKEDEDR